MSTLEDAARELVNTWKRNRKRPRILGTKIRAIAEILDSSPRPEEPEADLPAEELYERLMGIGKQRAKRPADDAPQDK